MWGLQRNFYNSTIKKMIAVFGTVFNDIVIDRRDEHGKIEEKFIVPVAYGPSAKWISRLNDEGDAYQQRPAIILPRISFEIQELTYDASRRLSTGDMFKNKKTANEFTSTFVAAPYDISFAVSILCKYSEDGAKIVEQILPYFKPEWTTHVKMLDDVDIVMDIPIILNSVDSEEIYESDYTQRRVIQWTLTFTMKTYFFGPVIPKKVIKFIDLNFHADTTSTAPTLEEVHIQPGMDKFREPTQLIKDSIHYSKIEFDDPWADAYEILTIEDYYKNNK